LGSAEISSRYPSFPRAIEAGGVLPKLHQRHWREMERSVIIRPINAAWARTSA
jgi:hypothetical protein